MKQILATTAVAFIGIIVLASDFHVAQSKAVGHANATNATNASRVLEGLLKNLTHVQDLLHNLTHTVEHLKLNQTNATGPSQNATRVHKAPHVIGGLNSTNATNATGPAQNKTQIHHFPTVIQHGLNSTNATNGTGPAQNRTQIHHFPTVIQHGLNSTNATGPSQNKTKIQHAPTVIHHLNFTNSSGNSSLVPAVNLTRLYQLTAQNSQQIQVLARELSFISRLVQNLTSGSNSTNRTAQIQHAPVVIQHGLNSTNATGHNSFNKTAIHHFPTVIQHGLNSTNATNGTGPAQNKTQIHHFPTVIQHGLNSTNATGPSQNKTQIHHFPIVVPHGLNSTNATGPAQNRTQIHLPIVHLPGQHNATNATNAIAKNITQIKELLGNLTQKIEQIKLF